MRYIFMRAMWWWGWACPSCTEGLATPSLLYIVIISKKIDLG